VEREKPLQRRKPGGGPRKAEPFGKLRFFTALAIGTGGGGLCETERNLFKIERREENQQPVVLRGLEMNYGNGHQRTSRPGRTLTGWFNKDETAKRTEKIADQPIPDLTWEVKKRNRPGPTKRASRKPGNQKKKNKEKYRDRSVLGGGEEKRKDEEESPKDITGKGRAKAGHGSGGEKSKGNCRSGDMETSGSTGKGRTMGEHCGKKGENNPAKDIVMMSCATHHNHRGKRRKIEE